MKEVFVRVGMMVPFTDEEIEQIKKDKMGNDVMTSIIRERGRIEGNTYIPENCLENEVSEEYDFNLCEEKKMTIKIINESKNPLPEYKTLGASGMDLLANNDIPVTIMPMDRTLIPTGLFVEIPLGFEGQVRARSGLSIKNGITLVNCVGTIDSDYRGELKIPVINLGNEPFTIQNGDRIAQLIITKYERIEWDSSDMLNETGRGGEGFGSTGV